MHFPPLVRDELQAARHAVLRLLEHPSGSLLASIHGGIYSVGKRGEPRITLLAGGAKTPCEVALLGALREDTGNPIFAATAGFTRVVRTAGVVPLAGQHCNRRRPPGPGLAVAAIRHGFHGTIGMQLQRPACGSKVFVTAAHVFGHPNTLRPGLPVVQPFGDNRRDRIGTLLDFTTLNDQPGQSNQADVAVVKLRRDLRNKLYRICNASRGTYSYYKIKPQLNPAPPEVGVRVISSGATSGFFRGYFQGYGDFIIGYENPSNGEITSALFKGQHVIQSRLEPADFQTGVPNHSLAGGNSGSIVVYEKSRNPLGMIFAGCPEIPGGYFVTPIETILDLMDLEFPSMI